jgi:hypothetical protein
MQWRMARDNEEVSASEVQPGAGFEFTFLCYNAETHAAIARRFFYVLPTYLGTRTRCCGKVDGSM